MKRYLVPVISILLVAFLATSCSFSTSNSGNQQSANVPNTTLTALFSKAVATDTPQVVVITNTPASPQYIIVTNTPEPTEATTPTATSTAVPTLTATTLPNNQPNPLQQNPQQSTMNAGYISITPTIDGSWSEWKDYTTQYSIPYVVYGRNNWTGDDDLSGSFAAAWDYTYLYLGVKVHDDVRAQNATGAYIYQGDSIELLLDKNLNYDYGYHGLNGDDYQLGVSAGNSSAGIPASAYLWYPSGSAGVRSDVTIGYYIDTGNVYRYEVRIPWSLFGINPTPGLRLGWAVSVSDNDNVNQNLQQTMISTAPNRSLSDPSTWGVITLTK